jgi:SAM-dependent methyltransferase
MNDLVLYSVAQLPVLQNTTYATRSEAKDAVVGELRLVQSGATGLVHNAAFDPGMITYDERYQNEQAYSATFVRHLHAIIDRLDSMFAGKRILEIGCGKGMFMNMLRLRGYSATGIDPAYEGDDPHVVKGLFTPALGIRGEGVVLRHVLEHIHNPLDFLHTIRTANGGAGLIYIEVPCFDWILENRTWYDVFYEHVNYFRLDDLQRMFTHIIESGRIFGDQYLYIIADLSALSDRIGPPFRPVTMPVDFKRSLDRFDGLAKAPRAIWGGSSKGVIFSIGLQSLAVDVDCIIDVNPKKQGRYAAKTGLEIVSPETAFANLPPHADIFVMNPNYLEEIANICQGRFNLAAVDAR